MFCNCKAFVPLHLAVVLVSALKVSHSFSLLSLWTPLDYKILLYILLHWHGVIQKAAVSTAQTGCCKVPGPGNVCGCVGAQCRLILLILSSSWAGFNGGACSGKYKFHVCDCLCIPQYVCCFSIVNSVHSAVYSDVFSCVCQFLPMYSPMYACVVSRVWRCILPCIPVYVSHFMYMNCVLPVKYLWHTNFFRLVTETLQFNLWSLSFLFETM